MTAITLAVPPETLADYLRHVIGGTPMREIARRGDLAASTVLRRIRLCEELRETPEWEAIFAALQAAFGNAARNTSAAAAADTPDAAFVLRALGVTQGNLLAAMRIAANTLHRDGAFVLTAAGLGTAAVMYSGQHCGSLPRNAVLAAVAFGWLVPDCLPGQRTRRLVLARMAAGRFVGSRASRATPDQTATPTPPRGAPWATADVPNGGGGAARLALPPELARAASRFVEAFEFRDGASAQAFAQAAAILPPRLLIAMTMCFAQGRGLGEVEATLGLPARSAKAVLRLGLEVLAHADVARRAAA